MGLCGSIEVSKEDMGKSKEIDTQLKRDKRALEREVKLLLLGSLLYPTLGLPRSVNYYLVNYNKKSSTLIKRIFV